MLKHKWPSFPLRKGSVGIRRDATDSISLMPLHSNALLSVSCMSYTSERYEHAHQEEPEFDSQIVLFVDSLIDLNQKKNSPKASSQIQESISELCTMIVNRMVKNYTVAADTLEIFEALIRAGCVEETLVIVKGILKGRYPGTTADNGRKDEVVLFSMIINLLGKYGFILQMRQMLQEMERREIFSNLVVYNTLLNSYGRNKLPRALRATAAQMEADGIELGPVSLSALVWAFSNVGDYESAHRYAHRLRRNVMDEQAYNALLFLHQRTGNVHAIIQILQEMREANIIINVSHYMNILSAFKQINNPAAFEATLEDMEANAIEKNTNVYNIILDFYGKRGELKRVIQTLAEMNENSVFRDDVTYNTLVTLFTKLNSPRELTTVYEEVRHRNNVRLSEASYGMLLHHFGKMLRLKVVVSLETELRSKYPTPNISSYNSMLQAYLDCGDRENFMRNWEEVKQNCHWDSTTFSIFTKAIADFHLDNALLDTILPTMQAANIEPHDILYTTLIKANVKSRRFLEAIAIFEMLDSIQQPWTAMHVGAFLRNIEHHNVPPDLIETWRGLTRKVINNREQLIADPFFSEVKAFLQDIRAHYSKKSELKN